MEVGENPETLRCDDPLKLGDNGRFGVEVMKSVQTEDGIEVTVRKRGGDLGIGANQHRVGCEVPFAKI